MRVLPGRQVGTVTPCSVRRARRAAAQHSSAAVRDNLVKHASLLSPQRGARLTAAKAQSSAQDGRPTVSKVLAANRGEIAVRIFRAAKELGHQTVAIYSPADRLFPHRFKADESYQIGTKDMQPVACYLDIDALIALAKEHDVDAIHPGYGFLSENAELSRRCKAEGIAFVGPTAEIIESLGDKTAARKLALSVGVPIVPGTNEPLADVAAAKAFADEAGYPVMLKAAMGGGGRGMRVVRAELELEEAFLRASNEALSAFGDGRMFIEKYVEDPRHIEVQILADSHGNVVHLYERDCSVQRRHQKVVEIAPAPNLDDGIRQALFADAIKIASKVAYVNAGTVEFMVDTHGQHYFLEVNPRIQVEHTCTEEVTGVDLVKCQLMVAAGATLAECGIPEQAAIRPPIGFAVQCRVTCEDPTENFKPDNGRIEVYRSPGGPGIRLDGAVAAGNVISRYYDSLLTKVISHAPTYDEALRKLDRALAEFLVRGIKTNISFVINVLRHPEFAAGRATTSFIERHADVLFAVDDESLMGQKLMNYLSEMVVNGPNHPGAIGAPSSKNNPVTPVFPHLTGKPLEGWKGVLDDKGPDGWAAAVRAHKGLLVTDTTMRDAHQSLLATRMRTYDLMHAARPTAQVLAPAASLEMWGGATFDVAMRFLHECPWERLERLREAIPNIPFQMLLRGANAVGYTSYPDNVVRAFTEQAARSGVDIFRVFDSLNYMDNLRFGMDAVNSAGGVVEGTICYSGDLTSPRESKYTLEYYMAMAEQIVEHGCHAVGIKDMAGVLKPRAATALVSALRARWPDLVIHVHTHDSAGTAVATQLAAAAAGADIVDLAMDAMSGCTSQGALGAVVGALQGTDLDTGLDLDDVNRLSLFWEQTRALYSPFESTLRSSSADVYYHEMPGGQYTNLKFQSLSLGLADEWDAVKEAYAAANRALGNIVKVTPSSKVVGDLANFMVANKLDDASLVERAPDLSFPNSVVQFMQGYLGQPPGGFPEPLRSRIMKDAQPIEGRPGASLPPLNMVSLKADLRDQFGEHVTDKDVLSSAMYPAVFKEFQEFRYHYGTLMTNLPTRAFLAPLKEDEEISVDLAKGSQVTIKFKAKGELQENGKREVFFETFGLPRVLEVEDRSQGAASASRVVREKANTTDIGSVGAPMAGDVLEVSVQPGQTVKAGQVVAVMSAMKMETTVAAPCDGVVSHVAVIKNDLLEAGDLLLRINAGEAAAAPAEAAQAAAA